MVDTFLPGTFLCCEDRGVITSTDHRETQPLFTCQGIHNVYNNPCLIECCVFVGLCLGEGLISLRSHILGLLAATTDDRDLALLRRNWP